MKTLLNGSAVALLSFAVACGSSGNAALSKKFNYGAPTAPTSSETSAATAAQTSLSQTTTFSAGTTDATSAMDIVAFADTLAALSLGDAGLAAGMGNTANLRGALRTAVDMSTCTTTTPTSVTFKNCTVTDQGFAVTINGSVTVSGRTVTWNIGGNFSGSDAQSGVSFNINHHQSGTMTVTDTTIVGDSASEFGGSVSGNGTSMSFGFDTAANVNLTYQASPFCVTSGTLEVKRVWTQKPQGATGPGLNDAGVELSWTGCNTFTVAHSQ